MNQRKRVLLIEDSPTQAKRLRTFLESEGLEVTHHATAEPALEQLYSFRPDLIIVDFHLPDMNGAEFCRSIRMNVNTRAIPVLMLTVEGTAAAQLHGLESGADDYLAKTADHDVLRFRVHALLRRSESTAPILDVEKRFSRARVLAIDDSPTYLYRIANELKSDRYIVATADSGERGLELMSKSYFDCVLVDFELPGLDGAEVCRRIRAQSNEPDQELVLIMLTSHEDKEHMSRGFEAGADDYISKSSDIEIIKARIRALLRRKFLVEENRHILNELKEKELQAIRARADKESAELRAMVADRLAAANLELERANRKLDLANQELEQFAYAAAHDMQEPLRMLGIYSQLLQTRYADALDETARQYLAFCTDGAKRMNALIRDLLLYARATTAEDRCEEIIDLNAVVGRVLVNLAGVIEETGAEVVCSPLPQLCVESVRMQQVFHNLISNALKYRRPDATPRVLVSAELTGHEWLFTVADNGIGIDPAHQDQVFGAFRRLHKEQYSGTGLGLAICQRVVQHYGGTIRVESQPGVGSRFLFTLPAKLGAPATRHENSDYQVQQHG